MEALTMYDPELRQYVEVYEAYCNCGAKLTIADKETYGECCESCANNYYAEYQQQSNEC